jgi:MerR family mercuric resistance operon transcriptional regulator
MDRGRTTGKLAHDAGVHVETVRYYEQRGLLKKPHRGSGWRRYDDDEALRVLRFVKRAQELGFSLDEVHELLAARLEESADVCARALRRPPGPWPLRPRPPLR